MNSYYIYIYIYIHREYKVTLKEKKVQSHQRGPILTKYKIGLT